jgi:hypothetical protein
MMNDIELHYAGLEANMSPVTKMEPNQLYLARIERTWVRIQLSEVIDDEMVRSFSPVDCTLNSSKVILLSIRQC